VAGEAEGGEGFVVVDAQAVAGEVQVGAEDEADDGRGQQPVVGEQAAVDAPCSRVRLAALPAHMAARPTAIASGTSYTAMAAFSRPG
jgi:hypothetical protein